MVILTDTSKEQASIHVGIGMRCRYDSVSVIVRGIQSYVRLGRVSGLHVIRRPRKESDYLRDFCRLLRYACSLYLDLVNIRGTYVFMFHTDIGPVMMLTYCTGV